MNRNFVEMLLALFDAGAEFLIVGAHAVAAHGHYRGTKDIDIWIRPSAENAERVWNALNVFGAPLHDLTRQDLCTPGTFYQIGVEPARIDILNDIQPLTFEEAWPNRLSLEIDGHTFPFLGRDDLIRAKRAAGRVQDLQDIAALEEFS